MKENREALPIQHPLLCGLAEDDEYQGLLRQYHIESGKRALDDYISLLYDTGCAKKEEK